MNHDHTHSHHDHSHLPQKGYGTTFAIGIGLNLFFVVVEITAGFMANSSALLADAGHNAGDVLSLVFAWTAMMLAQKRPRGKYTYGLRKVTILVSILNALLLFVAVGVIGWDAVRKFSSPEPVAGVQVMIVAGIGVVINTLTALLLMKGQKSDLNIRGAFLHMAADAGVSLGVVLAGLAIYFTGFLRIDPAMSLVIILIIIWSTWGLFKDSINLALDAVPTHIDVEEVRGFLLRQEGVTGVHDLHIWALSTTQVALTAHLVVPSGDSDALIFRINAQLHGAFDIDHSTLQIERGAEAGGTDLHCTSCEDSGST